MNQYIVEKLREGRLNKGLKQSDVTRLIGIKNTTLSNYENGNTEPDMDTFLKLCHLYGLDYSELLGEAYGYRIPGCSIDIKKSDIDLIDKYRSLDSYGQETVSYILNRELARVKQLNEAADRAAHSARSSLRIYTYLRKIACAGKGFYFDDIPTETMEAPFKEDADFIIGVNGDSMEPTFSDGDLVYVHRQQIVNIGDIGIFIKDGECLIKEAGEDGLISHNTEKYSMIPGTDNIICIGKVLGKVGE